MFDYRSLEAFAAVLEEGGFERAGEKLGLTQSAVSQRIKQLEELVGTVLVIRETPPRASAAGERLLRHYLQTVALEADALEEARSKPKAGFERLAIAVNADSLATWFFEATLPFWKGRALLFDLRLDDQDLTLRLLKAGQVCGCLSSFGRSVTGCRSTRLGRMEYRLCASREFVRRWFPEGYTQAAAAAAPVIHFNRDDRLQLEALRRCFGAEAPEPPAYYLPSTERIYHLVRQGVGYCMIPQVQAAGALEEGTLLELHPAARTALDLHWHRWALASSGLDELTAAIVEGAGALLD